VDHPTDKKTLKGTSHTLRFFISFIKRFYFVYIEILISSLSLFSTNTKRRTRNTEHGTLQTFRLFKLKNEESYSHSIVAGGFELMSYTTRFTPFTLLMISLDILARKSYGNCAQSAVMASVDVTALNATAFS